MLNSLSPIVGVASRNEDRHLISDLLPMNYCGVNGYCDPPEQGAEAPDWFYVPNVAPLLDGKYRHSYVMWKEIVAPLIAIKFVSGDGSKERDATSPFLNPEAKAGKFWVYEQAIRIPFYAIYEVQKASVEVYELVAQRYQPLRANDRGHYSIPPLGVELGIWQGQVDNQTGVADYGYDFNFIDNHKLYIHLTLDIFKILASYLNSATPSFTRRSCSNCWRKTI
jgi:Putative restriction endonuclease